jgi:hypothetical protein
MKTKYYFLSIIVLLALLSSCEPEDRNPAQPFVIAFEAESIKYTDIAAERTITLPFYEAAETSGTVTVKITSDTSVYGSDYAITPAPVDHLIELPFVAGQHAVSFNYHNLMYPYDEADDHKVVTFEIVKVNYEPYNSIRGYKSLRLSFKASLGATTEPQIGGPNQGDQVYVDLSDEMVTKVRRDSWDLGFYGGDDFRVGINGSIYMAVKNLGVTNIDAVTQASVQAFQSQVAIGTFDPANEDYIDAPNGLIGGTAIDAISSNNDDNKVYLVNLGYKVGTINPPAGSVAITGDARGWKKIRVLRNGNGYTLQYADLNSTTHQEVTIPKNAAYNFTFFSFTTNSIVNVEPEKAKWDLNFTVFTNVIDGAGSYGYSDFVLSNIKAGIKVYRISSTPISYANFTKANVNDASFQDDQRVIGADWRDVFTGMAYNDRFYVLKDSDGNYYKIRMLGFLNDGGLRGYPKFEYKLLQ